MKKKKTASLLAFFFGVVGLHRFYLGQRALGVVYFIFLLVTIGMSTVIPPYGIPFFLLSIIIAVMDGVLFAVMPQPEFDKRYNKVSVKESYHPQPLKKSSPYIESEKPLKDRQSQDFQFLKRKGIEAYRNQYLEDAIAFFNDALDLNPEDPAIHFNLACCHSRLEEPIDAFFHLEKSVEYGFDDLEKIQNHKALTYIRSLEDFELFVANGYQSKPLQLPDLEGDGDLLEQLNQTYSQQLLDKLKQLSELREKGILTEEEFAEQKRRLLNE